MACTLEDPGRDPCYEPPVIATGPDWAEILVQLTRIAAALSRPTPAAPDGEVTEAMMHAGSELLSDVSRWQLGRGQLAKQVYLAMRAARREA